MNYLKISNGILAHSIVFFQFLNLIISIYLQLIHKYPEMY